MSIEHKQVGCIWLSSDFGCRIGRVDPLPFAVKQDSTGLGKARQDFQMIETTVSQRRNLDSERMQFETVEQRQQREASLHTFLVTTSLTSHPFLPLSPGRSSSEGRGQIRTFKCITPVLL